MSDPGVGVNESDQQAQLGGDDDLLMSAIRERENTAIGNDSDPVSVDRATAIAYYLGEPFGNEIAGRSQVVSRDVFDTIEWIKPTLLRIFAGGEQVAEFPPQKAEDIEAAKQESDYVDYVIQRKNPWFMIAYNWFTDALLTRNAYAMAYWEAKEESQLERYAGLTDDQLALIGMDQDVQIVAHQAYIGTINGAAGSMPITLHNVDLRRKRDYGCVKICVLPPERCLVGQDNKEMSVRDASFFEYWDYKTISQLRIEGFQVDDDIADSGGTDRTIVDQTRDVTNITVLTEQQTQTNDKSMRRVKVRMIWIRHDYDEDGIAELRYCVVVGSTFLYNQEVTQIPVAAIVPTPMPHRHIGLSIYDAVADLQLLRSAMLRAAVDNQYFINNTRTAVDKNKVNLDDMLISRPGGTVRVDGSPGEAIMPFTQPDTVKSTMEFLDYLDQIKQDRAGTQKPAAGADIEAINAQPGTIAQLHAAASQKIELIARVIGEGVKELFSIVHEVILENPHVQDVVRLRGKWVSVDPRTWKKRADMTLTVGMGISNRQQHAAAAMALLQLQEKAAAVGMTSPAKVYNGLQEYTKALGYASAAQFFDEPQEGAKFPDPQPPFQVQVAQIQSQAQTLIQQMKMNGDSQVATLKAEADAAKTYFQTAVDAHQKAVQQSLEAINAATDRMHEVRLKKMDGEAKSGASER